MGVLPCFIYYALKGELSLIGTTRVFEELVYKLSKGVSKEFFLFCVDGDREVDVHSSWKVLARVQSPGLLTTRCILAGNYNWLVDNSIV